MNKIFKPPKLQSISSCKLKPLYFCIPYTGTHCLNLARKLKPLVSKFYWQVSLRVIMKPTFRIGSLFPVKDRVPKRMRSGVVYRFTCPSCQAGYIGKTDRHLHTRFCEHAGISQLTGKAVKTPGPSAIHDHSRSSAHAFDIDCFEILCSHHNSEALLIHESLYISIHKPVLNAQVMSFPLLLF